tara:strand:+ start:1041 stop:1199 length:159 start_codon:yes stop_codon:yes gene_type:complete
MTKLSLLIDLMQLEEKARTCETREEARACIRRADEAREQLWGNPEAIWFTPR